MGFENASTFVGWGAQHNLTFEQLFKEVQNFNLSIPEITQWRNEYEEKISTELRFYPKYGLCYELVNLTISKIVLLATRVTTKEGENVPSQIIITDKSLRTQNSVHRESHWGSSIIIEQGIKYSFMIKVEKISNYDPQNPGSCKTYEEEEFDKCNVEELEKIWKPLINCNPPWVSPNDQCNGDLIVTGINDSSLLSKTSLAVAEIYDMENYQEKKGCITPCTVTQALILSSEKNEDRYAKASNQSFLRLDFANEVIYTTKKLAYGSSEFLIDMGSSLGLWFGLSVFGLTDLGIVAFQWIRKFKRKLKRKCFM